MNKQPIPSDPSDDELEILAHDLLGVDFSSDQQQVEPFEVEEFDLQVEPDEGDSAETDPHIAGHEPVAEFAESHSERWQPSPREAEDDFGSAILDPEEEPPVIDILDEDEESSAVDEPAVEEQAVDALTAEDVDDDVEDVEEFDEDLEEADASIDTYWDALDGWDWNEESESKQKPAPRKSSSAQDKSAARASDQADESATKTTALRDDKDFGAGLEVGGTDAIEEEPAEEDVKERDAGRRSRRRRRRSAPHTESTAAHVPAGGREVEEPPVVDVEDGDDGFGAGLIAEDAEEELPRRRSRSGRRRRRRKPTEAETQDVHAGTETERVPEKPPSRELEDSDEEESEDEGAAHDRVRRYRNIPTWEQAISFLVRPPARKSGHESPTSEGRRQGGSGKPGSRKGSGRRGGRRHSGS
jgi:hypothetical protein